MFYWVRRPKARDVYSSFLFGTSDISWRHTRLNRPRTLLSLANSSSVWVAQDSWSVTATPRSETSVTDAKLWPESCSLCWGPRQDLFLVICKTLYLVVSNFMPWSVLGKTAEITESIGRKSLLSSAKRAIWTHADLGMSFVFVVVNYSSQGIWSFFCFTFISMHYHTQNKRKTNITWDKKICK